MRRLRLMNPAIACLAAIAVLAPSAAMAFQWEVRREVREGGREVYREKREAVRELKRCNTRECARREVREGQREVARERREARSEIRREVREDYVDRYYRGNGRWYRDGRWWDRNDYQRRYYYPGGNSGGDVLAGVAIGAAVVGVAAAIAASEE
jgi:hypothetical protein